MIAKTLRFFAMRSKDIKIQMILGSMYGLVECFGVFGAGMILYKNTKREVGLRRAMQRKNPVRRSKT